MKAFKQLNLEKEQRALWSYLTILSVVCFVILFSPVFAQQEEVIEEKPQIGIDVQEEYDEDGNLIGYDSTWSWHWNNSQFRNIRNDSAWSRFHSNLDRMMYDINSEKIFDSLNFTFWKDSSYQHMWRDFHGHSKDFFNDSSSVHFHDWSPNFEKFFPDEETMEKLRSHQEEFMDRFRNYQEEHKKLLDKYFYDYQNEDRDPNEEPKDVPKPTNKSKSGKI